MEKVKKIIAKTNGRKTESVGILMVLFQILMMYKPGLINNTTERTINLVISSGVLTTLSLRIWRNRQKIHEYIKKKLKLIIFVLWLGLSGSVIGCIAPPTILINSNTFKSNIMNQEIWKAVIGYEGLYEVSSFGRVKSLERYCNVRGGGRRLVYERMLKPSITNVGYYIVTLNKPNKITTVTIHQLVAESFLNHIRNGYVLVINHKDSNKLNNYIGNLEIITNRENTDQKHLKSSSIYTGVSWYNKAQKWMAYIHINGKQKHLGCFDNEYDAHLAYQRSNNAL